MQKKRFFSYLVLTLMIGIFAFAFAIGQTMAADAPVAGNPSYLEEGSCMNVNADSDPVLYDQITGNGSVNGAPDQDFETAFEVYSSEGADDFVVTGQGWHVSGVDLCGTWSVGGPMNSIDIWIYDDAAGQPAVAPRCSYEGMAPTTPTNSATVEVDFPSDCSLEPGTYWLAVQLNMNFQGGGQWFFSNFAGATIGNVAMFRNPGNGFGTGCTDWDTVPNCGVGGSNPNHLFAIEGTAAQPTDVSLTSFDGGSNSSVLAAIVVGIFSLGMAALLTIRYRLSQNQVD